MLSAAILLCLLPWTLAQDPYDPADDSSRPNNITGLYYPIYGTTGSYYNGTISVQLDLQDRNLDEDDLGEYSGTVCHSFIGDSIAFTYNALAGITKNNPDWQTTNPVTIEMYGVDEAFNLTWPSSMRNYSEYQALELYATSASIIDQVWDFSLQNSTSPSYEVAGHLSKADIIQVYYLNFNLTNACGDESAGNVRDEDEYLFTGALVSPHTDKTVWESWADSAPWPRFSAEFDNDKASIEVGGLFHLETERTAIVGHITITFQGNVDKLRSDELLMGRDRPEWNATLGFYGDPGLVSGVGLSSIVAGWPILGSVLLAMRLGFW